MRVCWEIKMYWFCVYSFWRSRFCITNRQPSTSTAISKEFKELRIENPLNLIFFYLNINSIISFPTAQFRPTNHTPSPLRH